MNYEKNRYEKLFKEFLKTGRIIDSNSNFKIKHFLEKAKYNYIKYFDEARIESHTARYSAIKKYSDKRVNEIYENAKKFIKKINLILSD